MHKLSLILSYKKQNRYSFNALLGVLESSKLLDKVQITLAKDLHEMDITISQSLSQNHYVIVAFSFFTTQLWTVYQEMQALKNKLKNTENLLFIAGGPHPTGDPIGTIEKLGFDIVVIREGEETFPELLNRLLDKAPYNDLLGIAFKNGKHVQINPPRPFVDLDKYPPFSAKMRRFGPIEITRGCPFVCYFCQTSFMFGGIPRHRSLENIMETVRLLKKHNLLDIRFITPNAFGYGSPTGREPNLEKVGELLYNVRKVIGRKGRIFFGSFPSEVRPEHVSKESIALIKKYANNDNLIVGAQTGSPKLLKSTHRGHTVEDVYNAVETILSAGLKANVDFIFGLPDETREDIELTKDMILRLAKMGARIHAHTFMPLPLTPFAKKPAGNIPTYLRKTLEELTSKGLVYGDWKKQEKLARKISRYLIEGVI